jgi:hypothetical protein
MGAGKSRAPLSCGRCCCELRAWTHRCRPGSCSCWALASRSAPPSSSAPRQARPVQRRPPSDAYQLTLRSWPNTSADPLRAAVCSIRRRCRCCAVPPRPRPPAPGSAGHVWLCQTPRGARWRAWTRSWGPGHPPPRTSLRAAQTRKSATHVMQCLRCRAARVWAGRGLAPSYVIHATLKGGAPGPGAALRADLARPLEPKPGAPAERNLDSGWGPMAEYVLYTGPWL